ncbi:MAG TPA: nitrate ABC transporter substrate-binding protein [Alphaproteobacteria bacterium]|nr:nitrate ABC transporter substrate-binding protein [Alphaproteobacteria bacterium]
MTLLRALTFLLSVVLLVYSPTRAAEPVKINFVTDWRAQAEHGGYYQAIAKGLYAKRGLAVTLRSGGASVNPPQLIAAGAADFVIASNSFQVLDLAAAGADVQAVAAIFQKDPQVLLTHPRTDIKSLADMKGKPILISDATIASWWKWTEAKFGFQGTQIRKYTFNLAPFLTDPKAIVQGYASSEPFLIEKEGKFKPLVFMLADYGFPGYGNLILARGKDIRERPQIVRDFVAASLEGWASYLQDDPSAANVLIKKDNPEMGDDLLAFGRKQLVDQGIILSGDAMTQGIGVMTAKRWQDFHAVMAAQGVYNKELMFSKAFNTRFLPAPAKP